MSSNPALTAYFFVEPLKSRFAANLSRALREQLINDQEYQQLEKLLSAAGSEVFVGCGLRVDQLLIEDGSPMADEWSDALVISPVGVGDSQVYFDTFLGGLKRFPNRAALLHALEGDTPSAVKPAFELRLIEGDLFEQRMQLVIDQQVERLRDLAARLRQLPSLDSALSASLQQQHAGRSLLEAASDLSAPWVQVSGAGKANSTLSLCNQTLVQTAIDILTGQPLPVSRRSYLRANGQIADATHSKHYDQWLADAVNGLRPVYESLLDDYWQYPDASGQTPRTLAVGGLAAGFRQALLQAQHTGLLRTEEFTLLSSLLGPEPGDAKRSIICKRLSLVINERQPLKLVGLISMADHSLPDLFVYSALHGIRRFANHQALADHYASETGRGELPYHLSLDEHPLPSRGDALYIQAYVIEHPLFIDAIDSIIGLQKRNLGFVLASCFADACSAAAKIDDALDVRHLVDRRLASFDGGGRWLQIPGSFTERWLRTPVLPPRHDALPDLTWTQQVAELEKKNQWLDGTAIGIGECARKMLNEYLAILPALSVDALDLRVSLPLAMPVDEEHSFDPKASEAGTTFLTLVDFLLEKVSGYRQQAIPPMASIVRVLPEQAQPEPVPMLNVQVINLIVDRVSSNLDAEFMKQFGGDFSRPLRSEAQQMIPAEVAKRFLNDALRLECELQERLQKIARSDLQMLERVLNRPTRSMRLSQGDEHVEVYSVYLEVDVDQPLALISNLFVLHRPLHSREHFLCWSVLSGVEVFRSAAALRHRLNRRLSSSASRERWLALISEPERSQIRRRLEQPKPSPLGLQFNRIDNDFVEALLQIDRRLQRNNVAQALQRAVQASLPAELLVRLTLMAMTDERTSRSLNTLAAAIQMQVLDSTLPAWLNSASMDDLSVYVELLQRYYLNDDPGEAFLPDLPSLQGFAREQLINHLSVDYPHQVPDPDRIMVTFTQYIPALVSTGETPSAIPAATIVNRETLTQFALNHFSNVAGAVLVVRFPDDLPVPEFIAPGYFKALVHRLDVGRHYRGLLAAKSAVDSQEYRIGLKRFIAKMPARMLLLACEMKLQKQLSAQAYSCLQNLLDMPDSIARKTLLDQQVTLCPMLLLAAAGLPPDPVLGVYLIGPMEEGRGPIVVHALFNESFTFKEYADKAQLLLDLQSPGSLQKLVLGRVDPVLRKRYDHGGFREAHIPWSTEGYLDGPTQTPGPTRLVGEPVSGNVLHYLFDQTLEVVKDICRKQTVTTAEDDWKSLVNLMSIGAEQVLSFFPGHLGLMLAAWQSHALFRASADSAYARRWGRALSEFTAALGVFMVSRQHDDAEQLIRQVAEQEPPVLTQSIRPDLSRDEALSPGFAWNNPILTPSFQARLKALEVREIALRDLDYDSLFNLYKDPRTQSQYAAIGGRVYRVSVDNSYWRVIGPNAEQGPLVRLDVNQQWQFDLRLGLKGGGARQTHFQSLESRNSVDHILIVEAQGLSEIRAIYHDRANMIVESNVQARRYLENCLFNLVPVRRGILYGRTNHLICEFFGVQWLSPALFNMVRSIARKLYLAITDPSLASFSSRRYVVGSNKPGNESTAAFISKSDPEKRIYLTERFFDAPEYPLKDLAQLGGFNASAHFRAGTLIHELTHLVGGAHDIADLDASAPFLDLLDDGHPVSKALKDELSALRATALSHKTPADRLFRKRDSSGWRDISEQDGPIKASILRITGTTNLAQARDVFLSDPQKRSEVILSNADSVAVLVMNLGRTRALPESGSAVSITSGG